MQQEPDDGAMYPRTGGYGLGMKAFVPSDPQWWVGGTNHPISPFPGEAIEWESNVYDDGTTYEGLTRDGVPHGRGVIVYGVGGGGGINRGVDGESEIKRGDKYEGEFVAGYAHGLGMFTSVDGVTYKGEWRAGQKNGCGVLQDVAPFVKKVAEGVPRVAAWREAKEDVEASTVYGTWRRDYYVGGPDPSGSLCPLEEIKGVAEEIEEVVTKARMFRHKPEGEATLRMLQDGRGAPAKTMQDPLDYPFGTKFLAPGPAGQVHPLPANAALKREMRAAADVWTRIYESYNLRWHDPKPGSDLEKAFKRWQQKKKEEEKRRKREEEIKKRREARLAAAGAAGAAAVAAAAAAADEPAPSSKRGPSGAQPPSKGGPGNDGGDDDGGDVDDDDLVAGGEEMLRGVAEGAGRAGAGLPTSHVFASVTTGLSRATLATHHTFRAIAERLQHRPSLTRPGDFWQQRCREMNAARRQSGDQPQI